MDVTAAIAIFVTIVISSAIVVPVVLVLDRRRARNDDPRAKEAPVPRSIVVMAFVTIAVLIFGFAGPAIFPNTWWGALMSTLIGKAAYVGGMFVLAAFLVPALQAIGLLPKEPARSTYVPNTRWKKK
jgi:small-conductance mechanosensitive channel